MQLRRPESRYAFPERHHPGPRQLNLVQNNKINRMLNLGKEVKITAGFGTLHLPQADSLHFLLI
jgi:hypothetical protein